MLLTDMKHVRDPLQFLALDIVVKEFIAPDTYRLSC